MLSFLYTLGARISLCDVLTDSIGIIISPSSKLALFLLSFLT